MDDTIGTTNDEKDKIKDKITEELSRQYSLNKISLEEYERLIEYAHKIETEKELIIIRKIINENDLTTAYKNDGKEITDNAHIKHDYTILSSRKMSGSALNEINGKIITILGDTHIIIDNDDLAEDENETFIDIVVVLGDIVIHVPKNITVINKAVPILGDVSGNEGNRNGNQGKKLIIKGKVILGNMTVRRKR
ncbi:MAG: cell wall-active antibiotics response protein [Spirochaetaceae bacterium]|nr:cell wall-active antibiotics response protein [Spirochaetaceae bacterium]